MKKINMIISSVIITSLLNISCTTEFFDKKIKLEPVVGFQNEPAMDVELNIHFYDKLNAFKKQEKLSSEELSYSLSLLNLHGENARFRWKGDIFPDSSVTISDTSIHLSNEKSIPLNLQESIHLINKTNDNESIQVFSSPTNDICSVSIILYQNNQATYFSTKDSFGIYLSPEDDVSLCQQNNDTQIDLISNLPTNITENDITNSKKLANYLNNMKKVHQLTNTDIGKMLAMSNLRFSELTYTEPLITQNIDIFSDGYELVTDTQANTEANIPADKPYIVVSVTNDKSETTPLGMVELTKFNDLKLIIHKQNISYVYEINRMKSKVIVL